MKKIAAKRNYNMIKNAEDCAALEEAAKKQGYNEAVDEAVEVVKVWARFTDAHFTPIAHIKELRKL